MFDFNSKYLQTKERIGSSATSTVYAYNEENNLDKCVVKHIQVNSSGELRKQMNNVVLGSNHDHPYIIPIKYCIQEEGKDNWGIYIKMPRMKGNLKEMLDEYKKSKKGVFPKDQVIQYLFCLASGLEYLERKGICHGNIKPSNLLVDKSGKAYLSDIKMDKGEDTSTDKNANIPGGNKDTLMYLAPEVFNRKSGHRKKDDDIGKSDAWSLGIVMLELCTNISVENMMSMPEKEKRSVIAQALIEIETNYGEELSNILSGLLSIELNQRKSFSATRKALMEHFPSITEVIQKDIEHKLMNILDSGNKKIISREAIKESGSKECDHDNQRLVEKMEFYIKSWKLWIIPAFLGLILGISMACTIFLPMATVPVVQYIKTADEGTSRVLETECPMMTNYEIIDDDDDPGVDIFVEFPDSDEEAEDFDEPQFNNTADAMKAKWGQYFDFLEDNETLYIAPIDTSKIYDDTVNNLLIDLSETRKLFNPESLEKIDFDLSWCTEITDGTIKYLAFHFSHYLKELKSLRMIFWKCDQITDDGLELLGEIITKNLKKLETIKLDFEGCSQIGDTGVATLGYHLKQRPEKIKALSLNFRACPRISDAGIGHLGYHLSFFTNLEELRLPISSCPRISDEGVKQISTYIGQNLVKLKLLVFNVGRSGLITDRGLGYFSWNIFKNLKDLEELWMNFEYSAITDEGIQQLSSSISQHGTGIQKLDLRFSGIIFYSCSRLKEEGFKNLGLGIGENLKDLKLLKLYVGKDKLISEEVKKQVREALSFIPELECVGCE